VGISSLWAYRVLTWTVLAAGLVFAGIVLTLRYWVLPNIENYRDDIARVVSERARQKITIGRIHANWDGVRPQLVLEQITVHDAAGRPALELARVDNTLSWMTLPALELRFHALDIYRPTLNVRRDERGMMSVGGVELSGAENRGGLADWLLRQRDIEIHDATIIWNDGQRAAPQLELKNVYFHLFNRGGRHRFGLRATAPAELASPLDLRGDIRGRTVKALDDWDGKLFLQLDYVDIAAWRTWLPFPIEFPHGAGALRAWLTFSDGHLVDAVADVRLANVRARLAKDLPELDLAELAGRIGWKQSDAGFEVNTSRLGFTTSGGLTLHPADFLLRHARGSGRKPAQGEMRANALELAPLVTLADHLPLGDEVRKRLAEYSPRGSLYNMALRWTGEWHQPEQYSVRGRFHNLAVNRSGKVPGFTGFSGTVDASERGGTLSLSALAASVEMPLVFRDNHEFEALVAQLAWTRSGGETELRLNNISFANAHLAGEVIGVYRTAGDTRGSIDLTGKLAHADARFLSRYIPLLVGKTARDWLDSAFIAGRSNNVTLRVKGALDDFPFSDSTKGVFQVTARVTGGVLNYARGWPRIENIAGDLVFRGQRMDVRAQEGSIFGVRLARVHVEIPDLNHGNEVVNVSGEAAGPTGDFLAFIDKSPVSGAIDRSTDGWRAQGSGKLALKISIPLREAAKSKFAGSYQFTGNTLAIAPGLPPVEQASGRVDFTESTLRAQNLSGVFLGGPITINAATTRESAVRIDMRGRINVDGARRAADSPSWVQQLRGATDWRALITARKRNADVVVESDLLGLAVDLPAPLVKAASAAMPFRFERHLLGGNQDRLGLSVGEIVSMILLRRTDGGRVAVTHGDIRFGAAAAEPDRNGVWVRGAVKALDVDRWLAMFRQSGGETRIEWGGVDVKLGAMDLFGRRFSELAINGSAQSGQWKGTLSGRELEGNVTWQPQGRGRIVARMKTLAIPVPTATVTVPAQRAPVAETARTEPEEQPPAIDLIAEQFINKEKLLGRLELAATPEAHDWRIDRLRITNPEGTFMLDGTWQFGQARPQTRVNLNLEVSDIGKFLARLGYPEGVRGGTAKLDGSLTWAGAPYDLDYPTLSGNLNLEAAKGQFAKLDPGIAKLLGILSLQALPRRVSLDFRDVFSEGFAFDEIAGVAAIERGVATTNGFRMRGPAARVTMSGEVDLARETQKLRVRIAPEVSDTVSIASTILGGPLVGAAAFLAQKALRDPLGQIITFDYDVTGTWSDPSVKRVPRPTPEARAWPD
jgi:uncharacterized protein (TIGR02099 family)